MSAGTLPPSARDVRATLVIEPAQAAVGQPVEWRIAVDAPAGVRVKLPVIDEAVAGSWAIADSLPTRRSEEDGRLTVQGGWRVFALEGGELEPPVLFVEVEAAGVTSMIPVEIPRATVAHALEQGEDAMRPAKGFRDAPDFARSTPVPWALGLIAILLVLALAPFLRRLLRRKPARPAAPRPLDLLAGIEARARAAPDDGRPLVFELTRLLRQAVDGFLGLSCASATDAEWTARAGADARVPEGVRSATRRILEQAQTWKYALESPSRFALDELLRDARGVLETLASTPPPPPASAAPDGSNAAAAASNAAPAKGEAA